jgi:hypothetical protein
MSTIPILVESYKFNRDRTLATLAAIEKEADPRAVLAWRPAPGRAHIGWQLMHIGITEELFATERLAPHKPGAFKDLWPRFRGGSAPDDDVPTPDVIRRVLAESREHLLATVQEIKEDQLSVIPEAFKERGWTVRTALSVIAWHEPHHQGQAHITYNLCKAMNAAR